MWSAALNGRLAYLAHRACGHSVSWKTLPTDSTRCAGDIICHDCAQVLWCRAHDPWRVAGPEPAPDHWGGTRAQPRWALFETLQDVLRLAEACPPGQAGDEIRRAACELIEAGSRAHQSACRRRILTFIAHAEWRHSFGKSRSDDPSLQTLNRLTEALRREEHRD